ncbi:MAG: hypothetical protein UU32_C0013G0004 [Candidatus Woesebacteria bacterium GW2011_GWB1_41_10]|uniref:Uncharacterized protein n=1 Tax=Candidatus Woesebacteria bacterium GW2011_GWB1_41_10 TaxID=1618577 RepID=A0A0G0UCC7_9BACT|nr:MAG: hypothetical protein UU32_C0013G0004 [Candidatus Woesebacteria bacterium GW2011_GWB1_41_10]
MSIQHTNKKGAEVDTHHVVAGVAGILLILGYILFWSDLTPMGIERGIYTLLDLPWPADKGKPWGIYALLVGITLVIISFLPIEN